MLQGGRSRDLVNEPGHKRLELSSDRALDLYQSGDVECRDAQKTPQKGSQASQNGNIKGCKTSLKAKGHCQNPPETILNGLAPNESPVWTSPEGPVEPFPAAQNTISEGTEKGTGFWIGFPPYREWKKQAERGSEGSGTTRRGTASTSSGRRSQKAV